MIQTLYEKKNTSVFWCTVLGFFFAVLLLQIIFWFPLCKSERFLCNMRMQRTRMRNVHKKNWLIIVKRIMWSKWQQKKRDARNKSRIGNVCLFVFCVFVVFNALRRARTYHFTYRQLSCVGSMRSHFVLTIGSHTCTQYSLIQTIYTIA